MDCSPTGSSVHGILQARTLEWVAGFLLPGIFPTQGSNSGLLHLPSEPPGKGILLGQILKLIRTRNSFLCLFHFLPSGIGMPITIIIRLSHHCILEAGALLSFSLIHRYNRASLVAQRLKHLPLMRETWVRSLGQEDPLEKQMATQYSCLENPRDGGAWWATVHGVAESQTCLSDVTFTDVMEFCPRILTCC